ncbi:MAG: 50S ribosomal protein L22, large subunit ribosomal protein L22 [Candidatus Peregrinibacteria bacterium GW2011_GWF2_38_29]|nr:MAG: 50S ribosomal protein L22, large subunit ribosomal protein L22 [Candidatus Peregrinibacteria bacterium GW2011_GWF2_38_29]HBB02516.1 50S ribosomal protein L22 [Candidatus Peregrinibacteria bacterium]
MRSVTKFIRIAPKKLELVAGIVREKNVVEALAMLKYMPKKAADLVRKALVSATANAENNLKQKKENLYISSIFASDGPKFKRFIPASRGRANPIIKKMSHLRIELKVRETAAPEKKVEKTEKTEKAVKKTTKKTVTT